MFAIFSSPPPSPSIFSLEFSWNSRPTYWCWHTVWLSAPAPPVEGIKSVLSVCPSMCPSSVLNFLQDFAKITAWRHDIFRLFRARILARWAWRGRAVKAQTFSLVIIFFHDDVLICGCSFIPWRHSPLFLKTAWVLLMWKLPKESVCLKDLGKYEENVALGGYVWIWATSRKNRPQKAYNAFSRRSAYTLR